MTKKKEYELITDITDLYAKPDDIKEETILYGQNRVNVKFRNVPWEIYNKVSIQASSETKDVPEQYVRRKQELLLRYQVVEVAGTKVDPTTWNQIDYMFGEWLRKQFYGDTGEINVTEEFIKNLMGRLLESIMSMRSTSNNSKTPKEVDKLLSDSIPKIPQ